MLPASGSAQASADIKITDDYNSFRDDFRKWIFKTTKHSAERARP